MKRDNLPTWYPKKKQLRKTVMPLKKINNLSYHPWPFRPWGVSGRLPRVMEIKKCLPPTRRCEPSLKRYGITGNWRQIGWTLPPGGMPLVSRYLLYPIKPTIPYLIWWPVLKTDKSGTPCSSKEIKYWANYPCNAGPYLHAWMKPTKM